MAEKNITLEVKPLKDEQQTEKPKKSRKKKSETQSQPIEQQKPNINDVINAGAIANAEAEQKLVEQKQELQRQQELQNQQTDEPEWTSYYSQGIDTTHFAPLFAEARKFYPKMSFTDKKVRVEAFINGQQVVYQNNSYTAGNRQDFEFIPLLLQWREDYLKTLLDVNKSQLEVQTRIDDDILNLHKMIKLEYINVSTLDIIQLRNTAEKLIRDTLKYCDEVNLKFNVFVNINRLHLKCDVSIIAGSNKLEKLIDVILD